MADESRTGSGAGPSGIAGVGMAAVAIACCAAWPILIAVLGGAGVAAVLGVAAGVLALIGGVTGAIVLVRRRRTSR